MQAALLVAYLAISWSAVAQPSAPPLMERLRSIPSSVATPANCDTQVAGAASMNGPDLFYGASICGAARKPVEASFLLNAAQNRSVADLTLLVPAAKTDSDRTVELYGFIYAYAGGPGSDEVLREPALRERFLHLYDNWAPAYGDDYDPGWNTRRRPEAQTYRAAIAELKSGRRQQLTDLSRLYSDDAYYSLHRRFQELQVQTAGTYREGTPEAELSQRLREQMSARAQALGVSGFGPAASPDEAAEASFPPHAPAASETIQSAATHPVAERCASIAERLTIAAESRILRVLMTTSPDWGLIWRADIAGGSNPPERFTCTERTSSSRPLDLPEPLPPLPDPARR